VAVPAFALDAVKASEAYQRDLARANKALLGEVGTRKVVIQVLVDRVADKYSLDKVVVHTAIAQLLRSRQLRPVNPYFVTKAE
jgi:hypothetical protein